MYANVLLTEENRELIQGQWRHKPETGGLQPLSGILRKSSMDSLYIRDSFASYFVSERGLLPWQNYV